MELPIFLSFIICSLLKLATGDVLYLDGKFCHPQEHGFSGVICSHIDSRNYSGVVYQYEQTSYLYFEQSPYMTVIPAKLPNVVFLKITQTQLQNITSTDLRSNGLWELDLSSNNISFVSEGAFDKLTRLNTLNLSRNALQSLPANIFLRIKVQSIDLSFNSFTRIDPDMFRQKPSSISILDVSYNKLTDDLEFLRELEAINTLYMSGNSIGHISSRMFVKNKNLKELFLTHNHIDWLDYGSFQHDSLKKLDLSHNDLRGIDYRIFVTIPRLEKLYLNGTMIYMHSIELFIRTINLKEIEIPSNYYRCDDLADLVKEMQKRQISLKVPNPNYEIPNIYGLQCVQTARTLSACTNEV